MHRLQVRLMLTHDYSQKNWGQLGQLMVGQSIESVRAESLLQRALHLSPHIRIGIAMYKLDQGPGRTTNSEAIGVAIKMK